jgi:hypothetical protein
VPSEVLSLLSAYRRAMTIPLLLVTRTRTNAGGRRDTGQRRGSLREEKGIGVVREHLREEDGPHDPNNRFLAVETGCSSCFGGHRSLLEHPLGAKRAP